MSTRKVNSSLLIPIVGLAAVLVGQPAQASYTEELVVYGKRPDAAADEVVDVQTDLDQSVRSANEALKARLDAELEKELERLKRPRIRIAVADIQARG